MDYSTHLALPEWPDDEPGVSTDEIAAHDDVRPATVRERLSRTGSYWGLVPRRRANGRLEFHPRYREILRRTAKQQSPRPYPVPKHRQKSETNPERKAPSAKAAANGGAA